MKRYMSGAGILVPFVFVASVLVVSIVMLMTVETKVSADAPLCRAAIAIDKSGSISRDQLDYIREQITRLFQPGGIYNEDVHLAFWSFSSEVRSGVNYNGPFNGFVSSHGVDSNFQQNLARIATGGGTNYEQALGFDGYVTGTQAMNTRDGINNVISQADVIIMMTDGQPNTPGGGGYDNPTARAAGRSAAQTHLNAGRRLVGGYLQGVNPISLRYVINGSNTQNKNADGEQNIFEITNNFADLANQLRSWISQECVHVTGPGSDDVPYELTPIVTSADTYVTGTDSAAFSYNVFNSAAEDSTSDRTTWTVKRLIVDRGQSVAPLAFGGDAFRNNYDCGDLLGLIGYNGVCDENFASGERGFDRGNTSLNEFAANATSVIIEEGWAAGTNVCFVLAISQPTQNPTPRDRVSHATCLTVGKRPFVQVHGGDLRVGRYFESPDNDEVDPDSLADSAHVMTSVTPKNDGKTYGSWAEYGVFSPGLVVGFASNSGLADGYASTLPNTQEFWSRLTFANTDNQYGLFTANDRGQGTIPDYTTAILASRPITQTIAAGDNDRSFNGAAPSIRQSERYDKPSGNLRIGASLIQANRTVIVNVPNGTVTITGNIDYYPGPYRIIEELPQLIIIAKRIEVEPDVTNVSAWLVSDSADDGTITTCNDPAVLTVLVCNKQLTINGPVVARHLDLRRTAGAGGGGAAGDPAEIINLPVNAYLWSQTEGRADSRARTSFVTELPPYF